MAMKSDQSVMGNNGVGLSRPSTPLPQTDGFPMASLSNDDGDAIVLEGKCLSLLQKYSLSCGDTHRFLFHPLCRLSF